ncbi:GIY-YIG nuclease family protein [Urbifossiella limnaea]|uniref:UvrABC system protein C n=1 Tax=Urbifossiella limnaea TaxID=2528023 RepID=A0A517XU58_9BACT|nr:GIY-YIG nuclease family protein [Urbifossiella limnaea]QDU21048.1 UvrABC system protein C [Urbifossiella limnaea]
MSRKPQDGAKHPRLFAAGPADGFGPSLFRPADHTVVGRGVKASRPAKLLRGVKEHSPKLPGVYGWVDGRGRVIYIGKAKSLRCRLMSYFRAESRERKAGKIVEQARLLVWEEAADEFAALLRELELIQRLRPKFNVQGIPGQQRYHYLCLGKSPAPYLYVAGRPGKGTIVSFGPLVKRYHTTDAARRLNDWFKLRDCPETVPLGFADQRSLFTDDRGARCLRFELGTCLGPCHGSCARTDYATAVKAVRAFLDGRDRTLLEHLKQQMSAAAAGFEFERAGSIRDRLQALERLDNRLSLLRRARSRHSFVYPLAGPDGGERWYLIHRGQVRAVATAPACGVSRARVAELIRTTFAAAPPPDVLTGGAVDSVLLVSSWLRKYAAEKGKLLTAAEALRRCASGGVVVGDVGPAEDAERHAG